jgi:hypothetical protein
VEGNSNDVRGSVPELGWQLLGLIGGQNSNQTEGPSHQDSLVRPNAIGTRYPRTALWAPTTKTFHRCPLSGSSPYAPCFHCVEDPATSTRQARSTGRADLSDSPDSGEPAARTVVQRSLFGLKYQTSPCRHPQIIPWRARHICTARPGKNVFSYLSCITTFLQAQPP